MKNLAALCILSAALAGPGAAPALAAAAQRAAQLAGTRGFVPVEGPTLRARLDAAVARAGAGATFLAGYQFELRPGVTIDADWSRGRQGRSVSFGDDGFSMSTDAEPKTANAGVLFQYAGGAVTKILLRDLDRPREYGNTPVYWLGRAGTSESLELLGPIASGKQYPRATEHAIAAVGLHAGAESGALLERIVRSDGTRDAREHAITWLGIVGGHTEFVAGVARDAGEGREMRKKAAIALGISDDPAAFPALRRLYDDVKDPEVRREVLTAVAIREHKGDADASTDFLIQVAEKDPDREVRKQALFWVGQRAGRRAAELLGRTAEDEGEDIEVRKHAVFAISQRDPDEAIPMLMKAARTSGSAEVRKQAMFWLSQIDDPRVLEFLKDVLQN